MNTQTQQKVVTRFAPSPTGFMHVGGIRTAIFAYLFAKKHGGTFLLRIEDTDKKREVAGAVDQIMESLRFLDITWDFGPDKPHPDFGSLKQSERLEVYYSYAKKLLAGGHAYVDTFTEEETEKLRLKAEEEKRPFLFREHRSSNLSTDWQVGKPLRFKVSAIKKMSWHDAVLGDLEAGEEALDDFIIIKEDGFPTYNFCHIVDDIEMGVTHIMRGHEFVASTPKFLSLYEALSAVPPIFVSLPPVLGESGNKKLSKRDGAKSALDYRDEGYVSEALFNFLTFLGFNPGGEREIYGKEELSEIFDLSRIQKGGARFNPEKLDWYNKEYMKNIPKEELISLSLSYFDKESFGVDIFKRIEKMAVSHLERAVTHKSYYDAFVADDYAYLVNTPSYAKELLVWKKGTPEKTKEMITLLIEATQAASDESMEQAIRSIAETHGNGDVLWPLRVSLSGQEKSPDPFTLMSVLGKEETVLRLKNALTYMNK